ncbi:uroporphyrinogen decarboxylase family protein [Chryseolinea sp. T2]|uniref:uroporphyrinogen decarboxylase family protein n=1 Tax=Chryseolinea sp. T2 TaxID=3129255 RepID=UPI003076E9D0
MLQWLEGKPQPGYTPAAFFLHFDEQHHVGMAAAKKHLEYFRFTDMDFVKIQYEQQYQPVDFIQKPSDWSKVKANKVDFYEPQLVAVKEIVKQAKKEALIIMTIYSPYMWAGQLSSYTTLWKHLHEDPEQVKKGLDALVESQLIFVRKCIELGVDGFYMSTQGSDSGEFSDPDIFLKYIKPSDLVAMREVTSKCPFNILHVCDYVAPYSNYDAVFDYPGQVVNCNTRLKERELSWQQVSEIFKRPNMGGMDRHGVITNGTPEQIDLEVRRVLSEAPPQFILGADCTVDSSTDWKKIKRAIGVAHGKTE